jgi:hypothetical protein
LADNRTPGAEAPMLLSSKSGVLPTKSVMRILGQAFGNGETILISFKQ